MKKILALVFWCFCSSAHAVLFDLNMNLDQGGFDHTNNIKTDSSIYQLGIYSLLGKNEGKNAVYLGWNIVSYSSKQTETSGQDLSLTSSDMGPSFRWQVKPQLFSLTYTYGIICKGKFSDTVVNEELNGTSHILKAAIEPQITDNYYLGFALTYYAASYKTSLQNSTQTDISSKSSKIYPSISMSFRY